MTTPYIIAGTGHRPDKLGGYDAKTFARLVMFAEGELIDWHKMNRGPIPTGIISGMALGFDQALAVAAINLRLPLHAIIPFNDFDNRWPEASRATYREIMNQATKITVVGPTYSPQIYQDRNVEMVDNADAIMALWNGTPGGTENCMAYAFKKKVQTYNFWQRYEQFVHDANEWDAKYPTNPYHIKGT